MSIRKNTAGVCASIKARNIVYLGPSTGCFQVAFVLGDRALRAAKEAHLPAAVSQAIAEAIRYPEGTGLRDLAPIITNLAQPPGTWVRLEASLVFNPKAGPLPDVLVGEIGNDVLAYMRTVTLKQIEGASGLRQLGEDLDERVAIRSEGKVRELIIQTLVVQ